MNTLTNHSTSSRFNSHGKRLISLSYKQNTLTAQKILDILSLQEKLYRDQNGELCIQGKKKSHKKLNLNTFLK